MSATLLPSAQIVDPLKDNGNAASVDFALRTLSDGAKQAMNWSTRVLTDSTPSTALDWQNKALTGAWTVNGSAISGSSSFITREVPAGTINGINVTFTLANIPIVGSEMVFLNGLLQNVGGGNDYTIAGAVITFNSAPVGGDILLVTYRK